MTARNLLKTLMEVNKIVKLAKDLPVTKKLCGRLLKSIRKSAVFKMHQNSVVAVEFLPGKTVTV